MKVSIRISLEEWIAEVFLVVVDEPDLGLELFATFLVAEFTDMSSSFSGFPPIPGPNGHGTIAKGTVTALDGNESRVLFVLDEFSDETNPGVWILYSAGQRVSEGLFVVLSEAAVSDPRARR